MDKKVQILVCQHKECKVPTSDIYLPIHAGKALSDVNLGITGDDTGDNISCKNPNFCELTAHYWAWKNLPAEVQYVGLAHYRRYLLFKGGGRHNINAVLPDQEDACLQNITPDEVITALSGYDIILPRYRVYPHSLTTDYSISHIRQDLAITAAVIRKLYPDYLPALDHIMSCTNRMSHYNMFFARRELFDHYSKWLFDILFEAERYIRLSAYPEQARVFGYLSERLLNVYCYHHKLKIKYTPVGFLCEKPCREAKPQSWYAAMRNQMAFLTHRGVLRGRPFRVGLEYTLIVNKIEIK